MKISERRPDQLALSGVPHTAGWMLIALGIGVLLTAVPAIFAHVAFQAGQIFGGVMMSLGTLMGSCLVGFALTQLLTRERVVLDKVTRTGVHSRQLLTLKPKELLRFDFDRVAKVEVVRRTEKHQEGPGENQLCDVELRIRKPRRSVRLIQVADHKRERAMEMAAEVSLYLDVELVETDKRR